MAHEFMLESVREWIEGVGEKDCLTLTGPVGNGTGKAFRREMGSELLNREAYSPA